MKQLGSNAAVLTAIAGVLIIANMVADRFGASSGTISVLVLMLAVLSVAFAALTTATMKVSAFCAAGQRQPVLHVALLLAGVAGGLAGIGPSRAPVAALPLLLAVASGLVIAAALAGAVRRTGASSLAQMMHVRFRSRLVSLITALLTVLPLAVVAVLAGESAVVLLSEALHLTRGQSAFLAATLVGLILLPGGALGLVSVGLIFGAMSMVAWGVPLGPALAANTGPDAVARTIIDLSEAGASLGMTLGYASGAAGLFILMGGAATASAPTRAIGAHLVAALIVLGAGAAAVLVQNSVVLTTERLQGLAPEALPPILYSERARGLVSICGTQPIQPDEAQKACARRAAQGGTPGRMLVVAERRDGLWPALALGLPLVLGVVHGLALPLLILFAFAALVRSLAQTLVHDLLYRLGDWSGTASGRLALTRIAIIGLTGAALAGMSHPPGGPALLRAAVIIAAAVPVPMLLLATRRRADWRAAVCGLVAAGGVAAAILFDVLPDGLGLMAAVASAVLAGFAATLIFASVDARDAEAADVFSGRAPGPLYLDRSA